MSGLVTLLSERLETIARLRDAGLPTWAYVTVTVRRSGLAADEFVGTSAFLRLERRKNRISSVSFPRSDLHFLNTDACVLLLFSSFPRLSTTTDPDPSFSTCFYCHYSSCRSAAHVDHCGWSSRWGLCPAHLCHHPGLPLLQAHRQRWAQRLVWAGGSTANSSKLNIIKVLASWKLKRLCLVLCSFTLSFSGKLYVNSVCKSSSAMSSESFLNSHR